MNNVIEVSYLRVHNFCILDVPDLALALINIKNPYPYPKSLGKIIYNLLFIQKY